MAIGTVNRNRTRELYTYGIRFSTIPVLTNTGNGQYFFSVIIRFWVSARIGYENRVDSGSRPPCIKAGVDSDRKSDRLDYHVRRIRSQTNRSHEVVIFRIIKKKIEFRYFRRNT